MTRGGARAASGPPPDPNALRRDRPSDKDTWTTLPAEGRKGRTPAWPLPPEVHNASMKRSAEMQREMLEAQQDAGTAPRGAAARIAKLDQQIALLDDIIKAAERQEKSLWSTLWHTPQAVQWENLSWGREVALYVRWQVLAELGDMKAATEARQWSDRLGLNPSAMQRLRWKIGATAKPETKSKAAKRRPSSRDRLTIVRAGDSGG